MSDSYAPTDRTRPTRHADRASYDRAAVHAVLDEALVCHVGFVVDGAPVVLPHLYARIGEVLYLHGSTGARVVRTARDDGLPVCVTVTLLDELVLARTAFRHSTNYRSVVAHGRARPVVDPGEKARGLAALVEAVVPGRSGHVGGPNGKELAATGLLRLDLAEVSLKVRTGGPRDEPEDLDLPYWAGVLPLGRHTGSPRAASDLRDGVPVPEHVRQWRRPRSERGSASSA